MTATDSPLKPLSIDADETSSRAGSGRGESDNSFLLVGVGASAGGVEALKDFFDHIPSVDRPPAFVVAMHLPARSPSHLVSILQETTSLSVEAAEDGVAVMPGCVYVTPPGKRVRLDGDELRVDDAHSPHDATTIDQLFRSLAESRGADGAGVVLSGTGTDGTLGVRAIKEAAGLALVQSPEDANHEGMPRSAIQTNLIDIVAPAAELPGALLEAVKTAADLGADPADLDLQRLLQRVFARVQETTGHDFANYRRSTVVRRLQRRMQVRSRENLADYLDLLSVDDQEVRALERELLITVTSFFRDPEAFSVLEETVVPTLFDRAPSEEAVRVWVAGCATGEEAYSVAMLLLEEARRRSADRDIQVFATDIDADAIQTAREGRYPDTIRADLSAERVEQFFEPDENHFRVRPKLRETVLFANHDLLSDPPFSKVDLVCCRNLLIYLNAEMQERVFKTLHYSLREPGFLFLGRSEAASRAADLFKPVDTSANIYEARNHKSETTRSLIGSARSSGPEAAQASHLSFWEPGRESPLKTRLHGRALIADVASVLVRPDRSIVHLSDAASEYLEYRSGSPTLPGAVPESMRGIVETGLRRAFDSGARTVYQATGVDVGGTQRDVTVLVRPVDDSDTTEPLALVRFEPAGSPVERRGSDAETRPDQGGSSTGQEGDAETDEGAGQPDVRKELFETNEQLQTVTEEYETTREEMEAANEELLSMNEELQSKNEELETSREELQSVNEELEATNQELKQKIQELRDANSVLENLMASTEIATLFLDTDMRIRRYTPRTTELFNVRSGDVGRSITDFTQRFDYDGLLDDAREVLRELTTIERELRQNDDRWFLVRLRPFRTVENRIDGVVITFVEITDRKRVEETLRKSERFHRMAVEASGVGTWDLDLDTGACRLSTQMAELMGYASASSGRETGPTGSGADNPGVGSEVVPGQMVVPRDRWLESVHPDDRPAVTAALEAVEESREPFDLTYRVRLQGEENESTVRWLHSRANLGTTAGSRRLHGASIDVTERRRLEREIVQTGEKIRHRIGQDLHDTLSSELASVAVRMQNLKTRLEADADGGEIIEESAATAGDLAEKVRKAVGQARSLAYTLIPEPLQEKSLPAALERLCEEEKKLADSTISFEGSPDADSLDREVAVHLYRIAREAIMNARKHAGADRVTVRLKVEDGRVILTVRDDGVGPPSEGFADGVGVRLMRYRADLIGGSFRIGLADGGGTVVRCEVATARQVGDDAEG